MIYLLPENATSFDAYIGEITDCLSCNVRESLNDEYDLTMEVLRSDPIFGSLGIGKIILAKPNMTDDSQPFVIEQISKEINGVITIYAVHMAQHRSKLIPVSNYTATSLSDAITKLMSNAQETNIFTITTNKTDATSYTLNEPRSMREVLGGRKGSLLDVYGGEYYYDRLSIQLLAKRGRPNAFNVVYGANMTKYNQMDEFDWDRSPTGVLAYYYDEDSSTLVKGDVQYSAYANLFPYKKTVVLDVTDKFDNAPTKAEVEQYASDWIANRGLPIQNIRVSFEDISTLPVYEEIYAKISTLQLGDQVQIVNSEYNTNVTSRIRSTDYDVLLGRYNSVTIGDAVSTINDVIEDAVKIKVKGGSSLNISQDLNGNLNIGV